MTLDAIDLVDDAQRALVAAKLRDISRGPLKRAGVLAGCGTHHFAVDDELEGHARPLITAADEEGDVIAADVKRRGSERADIAVAVGPAFPGVDAGVADVVCYDDVVISTSRATALLTLFRLSGTMSACQCAFVVPP